MDTGGVTVPFTIHLEGGMDELVTLPLRCVCVD